MPEHRSVSQIKDYVECPHRYYLARVVRVWRRPAAWLPQGNAVHEAIEKFELSDRKMSLEETQDIYREAFARNAEEYTADTPNLRFWSSSGPYRAEDDLPRRYRIGMDQVAAYYTYVLNVAPQETVWRSADGTPGVELPFEVHLDDGPVVKGRIDLVINHPDYGVIVRDIKTGNHPGDAFQLAVYAVALLSQYGEEGVRYGDYWMAKKGKPTEPYVLDEEILEGIHVKFRDVDEDIKAENWDPKPEPDKCRRCDVNASCPFRML